jgi:hypothetical protein
MVSMSMVFVNLQWYKIYFSDLQNAYMERSMCHLKSSPVYGMLTGEGASGLYLQVPSLA